MRNLPGGVMCPLYPACVILTYSGCSEVDLERFSYAKHGFVRDEFIYTHRTSKFHTRQHHALDLHVQRCGCGCVRARFGSASRAGTLSVVTAAITWGGFPCFPGTIHLKFISLLIVWPRRTSFVTVSLNFFGFASLLSPASLIRLTP